MAIEHTYLTIFQIPVSHITVKKPVLVNWSAPTHHQWKFNIDGSANSSSSGCGGIIRDKDSNILMAFTEFLGSGDCERAELLALKSSFIICYQLDLHSVCIETDSLKVYNWFLGKSKPPWPLRKDWNDIQYFADLFQVDLLHDFREGNKNADQLAKIGANGVSSQYFQVCDLPRKVFGFICPLGDHSSEYSS